MVPKDHVREKGGADPQQAPGLGVGLGGSESLHVCYACPGLQSICAYAPDCVSLSGEMVRGVESDQEPKKVQELWCA